MRVVPYKAGDLESAVLRAGRDVVKLENFCRCDSEVRPRRDVAGLREWADKTARRCFSACGGRIVFTMGRTCPACCCIIWTAIVQDVHRSGAPLLATRWVLTVTAWRNGDERKRPSLSSGEAQRSCERRLEVGGSQGLCPDLGLHVGSEL